jgi:type IV pilus biogenesis protein CpaD/CtpE
MRFNVKFAALVIATAALAGCNTVPIQNVSEAPVVTATGKPLTNDQVRTAIIRAGAKLGWQMKDEGPGMLVGTIHLRKHTAVVAIPYSSRAYSVQYRSSENLEESNGSIHKNYNGWIQNLTRDINAQLAAS